MLKSPMVTLILCFLLSRVVLYTALPTDWKKAEFSWHILDLKLLRDDFWGSIYHLHSQPPLFNMIVGAAVQFPYPWSCILFQIIFTMMALITLICFYQLASVFLNSLRMGLLVALLFCFFPTLLFAERWVYYTYPVTALIVLMTWCMVPIRKCSSANGYFLALVCGVVVVLLRSFYHICLWLLPITFGILFFNYITLKRKSWKLLLGVFVLIALAVYPYLKNYQRYDMFTASTWIGMNLTRTLHYLTSEDKQQLIEKREVTPIFSLPSFAEVSVFRDYYKDVDRNEHPAERLAQKNGDKYINHNHYIYAKASKEYQQNFVVAVLKYPRAYFKSVANSMIEFWGSNVYVDWFNPQSWIPRKTGISVFICDVMLIYCFPLFTLIGYASMVIACIRRAFGSSKKIRVVSIFILFNLIYTLTVANCFEAGETSIMRVPIDPFILLGWGFVFQAFMSCVNRGSANINTWGGLAIQALPSGVSKQNHP